MSAKAMTLLTQKVQHFAVAPGGDPALTQEDVCHALGTIRVEGASNLGRVKYADQSAFASDLEAHVHREICSLSLREGWRVHNPNIIKRLARMAILESINPMSCPRCNCTKHRFVKQLKIECDICKGTGRTKITDYRYSRCLGVDKRTWRKWKERYKNDILPIIDRLDAVVRGGLNKRLS